MAARRGGAAASDEPEATYDASPFVPDGDDLDALQHAATECQGCPLHRDTTGVVFGAGGAASGLMLVGEQPGDIEDRRQHPFVGPSGGVLEQCLSEAGVDPDQTYVTNAVKHFKHHRSGKRRIHERPDRQEIEACRPWLVAELRAVEPAVIVALGAVAARSVVGRAVPIGANHGVELESRDGGIPTFVTYHPSAVLRQRAGDSDRSHETRAQLTATLSMAKDRLSPAR